MYIYNKNAEWILIQMATLFNHRIISSTLILLEQKLSKIESDFVIINVFVHAWSALKHHKAPI